MRQGRRRLFWFAASLCAAMLAGCSGFQSGREVERVYVLHADSLPADGPAGAAAAAPTEPVPAILRVVRPEVQPGLDSSLIAITRAGNELDYIADSRWGASLPKVLAAFAVESLSRTGAFQSTVGTEPGSVPGHFDLLLTARHFEAAYPASGGAPTARVELECVLITDAPRRVVGRCDAKAEQQAADNRVGAIVQAIEQAAQRAMTDIGAKAAQLARADLKK